MRLARSLSVLVYCSWMGLCARGGRVLHHVFDSKRLVGEWCDVEPKL